MTGRQGAFVLRVDAGRKVGWHTVREVSDGIVTTWCGWEFSEDRFGLRWASKAPGVEKRCKSCWGVRPRGQARIEVLA
jgi:hypothetical protein